MSKKGQKALASATIMSLVLTTALTTMPVMAETTSISGTGRTETSIEIAKKAYANWKDSNVAVIASAADAHLVDALTVAPLAYAKHAPIFLTKGTDKLEDGIITELKAQKVTTVYVAGGTVTAAVDAQLKDAGITTISHLSGATRLETAKNINAEFEKLGTPKAYAVVNANKTVADALSVAAIAAGQGYEIVLANDANTVSTDLAGKKVYAIGGSSVLSDALVTKLGATRLGGNSRFETNAKVLEGLDSVVKYDTTYVADGTDAHLVDSLPGSVLAGQTASPIVLVSSKADDAVKAVLGKKAAAGFKANVVTLGGAVNATAVADVNAAINPVTGDLKAESVSAIGAKKLQVKFNKAVDDTSKAVFTVKNGFVVYAPTKITWSEDKTTATLENSFNYAAGDYSVVVSGLTDKAMDAVTCKVEAVKNAAVKITSTQLEKTAATVLGVQLNNQYGEKISDTVTDFTVTAYNKTKQVPVAVTSNTTLNLSGADYGDVIVITAMHNATALTATASLTVVSQATASALQFGNIVLPTNTARLYKSGTFKLALNAKDQYNNDITLTGVTSAVANKAVVNGITISSSDPTIIDLTKMTVDSDGLLNFTAENKAGKVVLTATSASGAITQLALEVFESSTTKTFAISQPSVIAVAGEQVKIPYMATDSFDQAVATKDFDGTYQSKVSFNIAHSDGTAISTCTFNSNNELVFTTNKKGTVVITPTVNGSLGQAITLNINDAAVPTTFVGIKNKVTKFLNAGTTTIKASDFVVKDQYGRDIDWTASAYTGYALTVAIDANTNVSMTDKAGAAQTSLIVDHDSSTEYATLTGTGNVGKQTITATITKLGFTTLTQTYDVSSIAAADVKSYSINAIPTIYANSTLTAGDAHAVEVITVGKTATGESVAIPKSYFTSISTSDSSIIDVNASGRIIFGKKAGSATISVYHGADKLANVTVTTSEAAPIATTATFDDTATYTVTSLATLDCATLLTVKDQYGVDFTKNGVWVSSDTTKATVANGIVTFVAAGTTTISYVTPNGVVAQVKVTVQ